MNKQTFALGLKKINLFLATPFGIITAIIVALLIVGVFFAWQNKGFQKDNKILLEGIRTTVDNTDTIISNQTTSLETLQADNKVLREDVGRLKLFVACLLAAQGQEKLAEEDIQAQCERAANQAPLGVNQTPEQAPSKIQTKEQAKTSNNRKQENPPQPPPENPKFFKRIFNRVNNFFNSVTGAIL